VSGKWGPDADLGGRRSAGAVQPRVSLESGTTTPSISHASGRQLLDRKRELEWNEKESPFHTVARLTLLPKSQLKPDEAERIYFDVTGHSTPDSRPVGSINRARWPAEVASREARMPGNSNQEPYAASRKAG
jgi:hypothetical protein